MPGGLGTSLIGLTSGRGMINPTSNLLNFMVFASVAETGGIS